MHEIGNLRNKLMLLGYYIMTIGGSSGGLGLDDVELTSPDPELFPVPECLKNLNPLPTLIQGHAGALDYSREFCKVCHI